MANNLIFHKNTMSSLEIAELTGKQHAHVMRDIRNLLEQGVSQSNFGLSSYKQAQPNGGYKDVACYNLTKKGCLILASGYDAKLRERIIDRWEVLETKERNRELAMSQSVTPSVSDKLVVATWLIDTLNLNDTSKLILAKSIADPLGLPVPDYVPSKGILKSATELLRENGCGVSAKTFNQKAIEAGLLCERFRDSSSGRKKPFKSITEKGLTYGENQVNPNNPKSTQPLWYEDKFVALLNMLGLTVGRTA